MTKDEKNKIIDSLVGSFTACNNFYITDIATLNSEKTSKYAGFVLQGISSLMSLKIPSSNRP